jgi:ecotin
MAVDHHVRKVERFITPGGEPFLIRYNSRLPIVVYAPEEASCAACSGAPGRT